MEYNFEEYKSPGGRILPRITLGKSGGINISAGFAKKYDIRNVVGARVFFDKEKMAIGIVLVKEKVDGMLNIKLAPKQGGGYINTRGFLIKYDIDAERWSNRYEPKEVDIPNGEKMFVIELQDNLRKDN